MTEKRKNTIFIIGVVLMFVGAVSLAAICNP